MLLLYLENNASDLYYRFNVPQGMQQIMLDEWAKKDDIKTYTDKYLRLNQTEQELLNRVKLLRPPSQIIFNIEEPRNQDEQADRQRQLSGLALELMVDASAHDGLDPSRQLRLVPHVMASFGVFSQSGQCVEQSRQLRRDRADTSTSAGIEGNGAVSY